MDASGEGERWVEALRFCEPDQEVVVRLLGDPEHEVLGQRFHRAEIAVVSPFVSGRARLSLSAEDLLEWERCLDSLAGEEPVSWPGSGRGPRIEAVPEDPLLVRVVDASASQVAVSVPLDLDPEELVAENRRILRAALAHISG